MLGWVNLQGIAVDPKAKSAACHNALNHCKAASWDPCMAKSLQICEGIASTTLLQIPTTQIVDVERTAGAYSRVGGGVRKASGLLFPFHSTTFKPATSTRLNLQLDRDGA